MRDLFLNVVCVCAVLAIAASVRADIASNDCTAPGQACENYFEEFTGVCVEAKCTRVRPSSDGGTTRTEYDCLECVKDGKPSAGGKGGGSASATGGKGGSGGGGKAAADSSNSDSGCAAVSGSSGLSSLGLMGAVLLFFKRRRARA